MKNSKRPQQQMELALDGSARFRPEIRPRHRDRAKRWFERMHRAVDQALGWRHTPPARPEQVYLPLTAERARA